MKWWILLLLTSFILKKKKISFWFKLEMIMSNKNLLYSFSASYIPFSNFKNLSQQFLPNILDWVWRIPYLDSWKKSWNRICHSRCKSNNWWIYYLLSSLNGYWLSSSLVRYYYRILSFLSSVMINYWWKCV